jgi:hypothetical protein
MIEFWGEKMRSKLNVVTIIFIVFAIILTLFSNGIFKYIKENKTKIEKIQKTVSCIDSLNTIHDSLIEENYLTQEENNLITKLEIYMPKNTIIDACIDKEIFLKIKNLVLEKSTFFDGGVISYFKYEFANSNYKHGMDILISKDLEENYYLANTNIEKIQGIILRKELYLDKGAIFYYTYKF